MAEYLLNDESEHVQGVNIQGERVVIVHGSSSIELSKRIWHESEMPHRPIEDVPHSLEAWCGKEMDTDETSTDD